MWTSAPVINKLRATCHQKLYFFQVKSRWEINMDAEVIIKPITAVTRPTQITSKQNRQNIFNYFYLLYDLKKK